MGCRGRRYLHTEFLVEFPREGVQLRLASLDDSTGQVPQVWARTLDRTPMHEEDATVTNQRANNDIDHSRMRARTSDKTTRSWR